MRAVIEHRMQSITRRFRLLPLVVAGATLTACFDPVCDERHDQDGDLGNARFVLDPGFFGCGQDFSRPVMSGAEVDLSAHLTDPEGYVSFVSSDPSVFQVITTQLVPFSDHREFSARIVAESAGDAVIRVERMDETVVDTVALRSRDAATFELHAGDHLSDNTFTLRVGETVQFSTTVRDANGQQLYPANAGRTDVDPPDIAGVTVCDPERDPTTCVPSHLMDGFDGYAMGMVIGSGILRQRGGGIQFEVGLRVDP